MSSNDKVFNESVCGIDDVTPFVRQLRASRAKSPKGRNAAPENLRQVTQWQYTTEEGRAVDDQVNVLQAQPPVREMGGWEVRWLMGFWAAMVSEGKLVEL